MAIRIWVDDWQMQCCGDEFAVGDEIEWDVRPAATAQIPDTSPLSGGPIHFYEDHHEISDDPVSVVTGRVAGIQALYLERDLSTVAETRRSANGWEREKKALSFRGYVVDIDGAVTVDAAVPDA